MGAPEEYDPRYLAGVLFFNRRDFFAAHEVWEELWHDCPPGLRKFVQGLIQAAVALYHWDRGNARGAKRLFLSGRAYMSAYPDGYLGLDVAEFWRGMARALADVLSEEPRGRLDAALVPTIELLPPPACWPDPDGLLPGE
jgi:predicted metal-dependent hydrolase